MHKTPGFHYPFTLYEIPSLGHTLQQVLASWSIPWVLTLRSRLGISQLAAFVRFSVANTGSPAAELAVNSYRQLTGIGWWIATVDLQLLLADQRLSQADQRLSQADRQLRRLAGSYAG